MKRLWALALCAAAPLCEAGETRIAIGGDWQAPLLLWVAPVGAEGNRKAWIELPREASGQGPYRGDYRAVLKPGRYSLVAAQTFVDNTGGGLGPRYNYQAIGPAMVPVAVPVRGVHPQAAQFEVGDGALDLGEVEFIQDPSLALMLRRAGAAGWVVADTGDDRDPELARLRSQLRWMAPPIETADGRWLLLASGNRLIVRDAQGGWRGYRVMDGGRPTLVAPVSADTVVIGGIGPRLEWRALDGAVEPLNTGGLAAGTVSAVHCDGERRCTVAVSGSSDVALYHSADARQGGWTQVARFELASCGWVCTSSAAFHALPGETVAIGDKKTIVRVRLNDGATERGTLPFMHISSTYSNGRLMARDKYSTDGGRTWQDTDMRMRDGVLQFDGQGRAFAISVDIGMTVSRPTVRRSDDGGRQWRDIAQLPSFGAYVVGGASPVQYLHAANNLWVSLDAGATWRPDDAAYQALANFGSER